MDKKKNRTDLLDAGRQKLQQFRQKKVNKGTDKKKDAKGSSSQGKPSKRSSKSEKHELKPDTSAVDAETAVPLQSTGENLTPHEEVVKSSKASEYPLAHQVDVPVSSSSSELVTSQQSNDQTTSDDNAEVSKQVAASGGESSESFGSEAVSTIPSSNSEPTDFEKEIKHADASVDAAVLHPPSSDNLLKEERVEVEREPGNNEMIHHKSSLHEEIPDVSLIHARGDQITDVGEMQEDDGSHVEQLAESLHKTDMETIATEEEKASNTAEAYSCSVSNSSEGPSDSVATHALEGLNVKHTSQQIEDVTGLHEEKTPSSLGAEIFENNRNEALPAEPEDTNLEVSRELQFSDGVSDSGMMSHGEPVTIDSLNPSKEDAASHVHEGPSVSLLQLIDIVRGLGEDEFEVLCKSREMTSNAEQGANLLERLKEELYVATSMKDILVMQLEEHSYHLQDEIAQQQNQRLTEISQLHASFSDVKERNESLSEEISECRSKLYAVTTSNERLENQLAATEAQVEKFTAKVNELQFDLENTQLDLSKAKDRFINLQVENETLVAIVSSVYEEKKELVEEKESKDYLIDKLSSEICNCNNLVANLEAEHDKLEKTIVLLTDEKMEAVEEKYNISGEVEKLHAELTQCKTIMTLQEVDYSNTRGTLSLLVGKEMKLEEDNLQLSEELEKMHLELSGHQILETALWSEYSILKEGHTLLQNEIQKFLDEKEHLVEEKDRLTDEVFKLQGHLSTEKVEQTRLQVELGEAMARVDKLAEENAFLSISLEEHKAKVGEIDDRCASGFTANEIPDKLDGCLEVQVTGESLEVIDNASEFVTIGENLKKTEKILQSLEEAIKQLQADSLSFKTSSSKVVAPAVSKLIQAFESKVQHDDQESDATPSAGERPETDIFIYVKDSIRNLRSMLEQLTSDSVKAYFKFKRGHEDMIAVNEQLQAFDVKFDNLQEHINLLEEDSIETGISFEALKHYSYELQAKNNAIEFLCESLKVRNDNISVVNTELNRKLHSCLSRIHGLEIKWENLQGDLSSMSSSVQEQLDGLLENSERAVEIEHVLTSSISEIDETVGRLDDYLVRFDPSGARIGLDVNKCVADSVNLAVQVIGDLEKKLEAACRDYASSSNSYEELKESFNTLLEKNKLATDTLHKVYAELKLVADPETQNLAISEPLTYGSFQNLMDLVRNSLSERLELQSLIDKLHVELSSKSKDVEELTSKSLNASLLQKLVENVRGVVEVEAGDNSCDESPGSHVEFLVSNLVNKFRETKEMSNLFREQLEAKDTELMDRQEDLLRHKTEIGDLQKSLSLAEESLVAIRSELQEKSNECEQSEQRLLSTREKLSIAVAKGKGLVVQRDNLKKSLAETSAKLERCSEEVKLKDSRLQELEANLKTYAEAGERVEALESELSYIRNSATALRESFLLKDSLLHRIEESLEDLDLPEHFHARDILEKVEWLARAASGGNSLPRSDWNQKSSDGAAAGYVITEPWRDDVNSGDDLRIKFEELQGKFYGLAEQNEMLEQSLMERNNLVQRWEELLGTVDMPTQLQSLEVDDKIEWLTSRISEVINDRDTLQQNIDNFENYCRSVSADLEVSQKHVVDVEAELQSVINERANLSDRLENLSNDHEKVSGRTTQLEVENEKLLNEVTVLHEKLAEKLRADERLQLIEGEVAKLRDLINDTMQENGMQNSTFEDDSETLEGLMRKLIEFYKTLVKSHEDHSSIPDDIKDGSGLTERTSRDIGELEVPDVASLKKDLEDTLHMLDLTREERDSYMQKQQSLVAEKEALDNKIAELQELLSNEEQKSASIRGKLNIAVRRGKSVVQERDSLKQTRDELSAELAHLRSEMKSREDILAGHEKKIRELESDSERLNALDSEYQSLQHHLKETQSLLEERSSVLSRTLSALNMVDIGDGDDRSDPVWKIQRISQIFEDMRTAVSSAEQDSRKSRRAAELLVAELNEVQERNDGLQEDLSNCTYELQQLSGQKDAAEATKEEALSRLEELSIVHDEERRKQYSQLLFFGNSLNALRDMFAGINRSLAKIFTTDSEFLQYLEANLDSCGKQTDTNMIGWSHLSSTSLNTVTKDLSSWSNINVREISRDGDIIEICDSLAKNLDEFTTGMTVLNESISKHLVSWHEQVNTASKVMDTFFQSISKEKDSESASLRQNLALLHGSCSNVLAEIESKMAEVVGHGDMNRSLHQAVRTDGRSSLGAGDDDLSSLDSVRSMMDRLSMAVKDFVAANAETVERNQKEMRMIIANLQRELQEKDIQKDEMCTELVGQIKDAQASAKKFASDLQSANNQMRDMNNQLEIMARERDSLEERVKELHDEQSSYSELHEKFNSVNELVAAKDQEIEALMQALDEEETQMEDLRRKVTELEQEMKRKDLDLQNTEASRGKISKKLSVTVEKFDELHHLSETLLAEVEKLQQQLQDKDSEISFLRQEVTRCTNEVLATSQMSSKRESEEIQAVLSWFDSISLLFGIKDSTSFDVGNQIHSYMEVIEKSIVSLLSELDELRLVGQSKDLLLEAERSRVIETRIREETLEKRLREKESLANIPSSSTPEIVEVEPSINKRTAGGTSIPSQVRSLRKGSNNDQVAIRIDTDQTDHSHILEDDDDDDKAHGFKSLAASRVVPTFTRPVTDIIDGLWVSCDRTLMRKPVLRLGIMIYWAILHALLATFVV